MGRDLALALAALVMMPVSRADAQFHPELAGVVCDSMGRSGCAIYKVAPPALFQFWRFLDGKRVRVEGFVTLQCHDQTLYFAKEDADSLRREVSVALFGDMSQFGNLADSTTRVVLQGVFRYRLDVGVRRYLGALYDVAMVPQSLPGWRLGASPQVDSSPP